MYANARRRRRPSQRLPKSKPEVRQRLAVVVLVAVVSLSVLGLRQVNTLLLENTLVDIRDLPDSLLAAGFALSGPREIEISVAGERRVRRVVRDGALELLELDDLWLLDLSNRKRIWDLRGESKDRAIGDGTARQRTISLHEGDYVLFCAVRNRRPTRDMSWVSWLEDGEGSSTSAKWRETRSGPFFVTVTGRGRALTEDEIAAALATPRTNVEHSGESLGGDALADLTSLENDEARFAHFTLRRRTDVRVRAIGEGSRGEMFDYGWIVNTKNGRTVWEMEYRGTEHAGGDRKNRLVDSTLSLGRGTYVVYFVTDDSHSFEGWNARPPSLASDWGIRVSEVAGSDARPASAITNDGQWEVAARLVAIRNETRRRTWFTLDRRTRVRVYALGEGDRDEMYDFAWIEDGETRSPVWRMTYRNSEHAGGAAKNRLVDSAALLPAGEYVLHYESDDSHSPESWNAAPPRDRSNYGVTVLVERR